MTSRLIFVVWMVYLQIMVASVFAQDWPAWRGPNHNGVADSDQHPPTEFGPEKNVLWSVDVPGRGHGAPIVVNDKVFLASADEKHQSQMVLCFDRKTGIQFWSQEIHRGKFPKTNKKASQASSAVTCDGERLFITFVNDGVATTTALNLDGEQIWQRKITDYVVHQGYGASALVYRDTVIVVADTKCGGAVVAMNRADGKVVWRVERPKKPNYPSPVVYRLFGKDQLLLQGCNLVKSLDPASGETHWEIDGATIECVTTMVTDGTCVFSSGGYDRNHVAAIRADGSGEIVWQNNSRVYVPSMVVKDGYLYAVLDAGVAACWRSDTGKEMWKKRLAGGTSASLVLVGDLLYSVDESGTFSIFRANPNQFEVVAQNKLGDEALATPAICGGQIFARVAYLNGDTRNEKLYCLSDLTAQ